jgi:hypothetical protein
VAERITQKYLVQSPASISQQQAAEQACDHVLYCQRAVQWSALAPMDTLRCAFDKNQQRRRIILDLIASQMFHVSTPRAPVMQEFLSRP